MVRGAILPPASIVALPPAAPVDTPQRSMAVTAIRQALGASIVIRSIAEAKPAPAAVRLPTTMLTIRIATVRGYLTVKRSIGAPRRVRPAAILAMNTLTTPTPTATESATIAAQRFR